MPPDQKVRFDDQGDEFGAPPSRKGGMDITGMLVRWGLVSSSQEAQYVLGGAAALILLATVWLIWKNFF